MFGSTSNILLIYVKDEADAQVSPYLENQQAYRN